MQFGPDRETAEPPNQQDQIFAFPLQGLKLNLGPESSGHVGGSKPLTAILTHMCEYP